MKVSARRIKLCVLALAIGLYPSPNSAQALDQDFGATIEMVYRALTGAAQQKESEEKQPTPRRARGEGAEGDSPFLNRSRMSPASEQDDNADRSAADRSRRPTREADMSEREEREERQSTPASTPTTTTTTSAANESAAEMRKVAASLSLGDGRTISGQIHIAAPERLLLRHVRDGIRYERSVRLSEIKAIELKRWRGRAVREVRDGQVFRFEANRALYILNDGARLVVDGPLFPFLNDFALSNQHGAVRVFSFWIDLQKPDGSWYTGMQGPAGGERTMPHPDVLTRIVFQPEFDG